MIPASSTIKHDQKVAILNNPHALKRIGIPGHIVRQEGDSFHVSYDLEYNFRMTHEFNRADLAIANGEATKEGKEATEQIRRMLARAGASIESAHEKLGLDRETFLLQMAVEMPDTEILDRANDLPEGDIMVFDTYYGQTIRSEWVEAGTRIFTDDEEYASTDGSLVYIEGLDYTFLVKETLPLDAIAAGRSVYDDLTKEN